MNLPHFDIQPVGEISKEFLVRNIVTFKNATDFIAKLDYGRNANKNDLKTLFTDNCGTCSTKHAVLKQLADENGFDEIKLVIGIFKMNAENTSEISKTLEKYNLEFIPEAHNYLKYRNQIFDFTKVDAKPSDFENDLMEELEIFPNQISSYKVDFHKKHLQNWLDKNPEIPFDLEEIWAIREQCIQDLAAHLY
jgi:thiol-disulfide isomerase/thioredoxin